jgi:hypothetical protein
LNPGLPEYEAGVSTTMFSEEEESQVSNDVYSGITKHLIRLKFKIVIFS